MASEHVKVFLNVSIHAPREGSDSAGGTRQIRPGRFNPRSPRGERRRRGIISVHMEMFQSTLPARGATRHDKHRYARRTGFNPRSPRGERHADRFRQKSEGRFNPRSPRGERPFGLVFDATAFCVSIHAPREGSDAEPLIGFRDNQAFQSTLPARGATRKGIAQSMKFSVSIHAPREGSDQSVLQLRYLHLGFNPRSPRGERLRPQPRTTHRECFNPRSPRGERPAPRAGALIFAKFQSTLPARGATVNSYIGFDADVVSIHAPREGSDQSPRECQT